MIIKNPLVIIPARGGSKGVPGKNIKPLAGIPLIYYTIDSIRELFSDEQIIVSTDDIRIKECVEQVGIKVPFLRPAELATDEAGIYEVLMHALKFVESNGYFPDAIILLQVTSPFRKSEHIRQAIDLFNESTEMVVSVKKTGSNPYYVLFEENEQGWLEKSKPGNFATRQQCPEVWEYNGAIYIISTDALKTKPISDFTRLKKYVMDDICSLDIDTKIDWMLAELILSKGHFKK
jgi:CMP-N,N'-diacetyllegionaminic acid synthase